LAKESSTLDSSQKQLSLHKRSVHRLSEFEGNNAWLFLWTVVVSFGVLLIAC